MANIITACRILCGAALLFFPVFSPAFWALYWFGGITDMIDGTVARLTGTAGDTGARLDTIADLVFLACCAVKLIPALTLPMWLWAWIAIIAVIRIWHIAVFRHTDGRLFTPHTVLNKVTGILLFLYPLTIQHPYSVWYAAVVCTTATAAALSEKS